LIQTDGDATYPSLSESPYGQSNYYVLNFNDNISSLGTLYILLLVNNMHVIASGFTSICYSSILVRTFFVCWYVLGVLFLLNLLTASLLSSFLSFWIVQKQIVQDTKRNNFIIAQREEGEEEGMNPLLRSDQQNDSLESSWQRSESFGSSISSRHHHPSISLRKPSSSADNMSSIQQTSTLDQEPATGGIVTTHGGRGRSQTVTVNSVDDMFHWFGVGSTVWEGEHINIAQSNPGDLSFSSLPFLTPPLHSSRIQTTAAAADRLYGTQ
jgi:hypothetical protein